MDNLTALQRKIMDFLFDFPTSEFNLRELARKLNVSATAVSKSIKLLEKQKFVKNKKKFMCFISLNRDNEKTVEIKRISNLQKLYNSGIIAFLSENYPGSAIILFGSYAFGEDIEKSDIDIAVIGVKEKQLRLEKFERKLNRKINLQFFDSFRKIDENLQQNLINGIILKGNVAL